MQTVPSTVLPQTVKDLLSEKIEKLGGLQALETSVHLSGLLSGGRHSPKKQRNFGRNRSSMQRGYATKRDKEETLDSPMHEKEQQRYSMLRDQIRNPAPILLMKPVGAA